MLSMSDRFEVNAAIERLVADGTEFDPLDAMLLIQKIPLASHAIEISFRSVDETPKGGTEQFATGHGNVQIDEDRPRVKEGGLKPEWTRVGGYKLLHRPGQISIALMWAETKIELDGTESEGQSALLIYDRVLLRPLQLRALKYIRFEFVLWPKPRKALSLSWGRFLPWKTPSGPGPFGRNALPTGTEATHKPNARDDSTDLTRTVQAFA